MNVHLTESQEWDPRTEFIDNVGKKVYMVIPAFLCGLLIGVVLWGIYILLFKTGISFRDTFCCCLRRNVGSSRTSEDSLSPPSSRREFPDSPKTTTMAQFTNGISLSEISTTSSTRTGTYQSTRSLHSSSFTSATSATSESS